MKIRIVNLDFYMSNSIPNLDILYSEFRGSTINHVPVIRIYGSTEEGEKICLHIHRVFPYIYIPYDSQKAADGFLYQVASALDKAINLSLGQASANVQHVYKVCLVSGIPIYGYHARSHQFLKLYFYNPLIVKKACMLLQNGSILGKVYQPHEAHIPYILQFMIDYNLHGMSFIRLADMKYRSDKYSHEKYPGNSILPPSIHKMSVCKLEADATADCILNREEINPGQLTVNPGIRVLWEDEEQRRRNNGESSLVEHCLTQNRLDVSQTATHVAYKKLLDDKLRMKPRSSEVSPHLEQSIYPAETPPSSDVLDASIIENHIFSSQNTDDSSVLDETITENFNLNSNDLTLDEDAQKLFDLLQNLKEDNVEKDSILSQVPKEQESDEEEQDLSLPLNATQTPCKLDETSQKNTDDYLNQSYFESVKIPQLDGAYDNLLMENKLKPKRGRKKYDIEKKTSEAFQPTIPKAKKLDGKNSIKKNKLQNNDLARDTFQNSSCKSKLKDSKKKTKYETIYLGTTSGKKGRGRKMTFKVKTSAILYKSRSKYSRTPCQRCENNNNSSTSNKKGSPCIKHYFGGLLKISNVVTSAAEDLPKNEDHQEIESDIEKVIEDICQDINENTENKEAFNREVLNVEDKYGELTKYLKSELQDSTLDGAKFLTKVEDANDQNKSETRSKRKAIPTKRLLEETSQTCPSNLTRKPRNRNLCGKTKNSLTKFSSNCKTCENHVKLTKKSKANRRTHEKTKETTMVSRNKVSFKGDNLAVKASILQKPETLRNAATQIEIVSRKQQESSNCKEIDLDIEEVIKDICQDINEEITSSVNSKNKEDQIEESKAEILKIEDKYGKSTKISNSELEDSTVDRAKVSYQIKNVAYVQEIAKPIDQDSVESDGKSKVRNRRKSIPTKRLPDGTSQKCTSNFSRRSTHTSFKRKTKDVSTSTSDSKMSRNRNKSSKKPNTNERIAKYTKQTAIQSKDELIFKENNSTVPARILQKPETVEDTSTIMENISKTEKNNHEEIDLDIEKVIKDICQDFCEEKTPSKEILEISQNWSKATKAEKDVEGLTERIRSKETTNTSSLSEEDMKIKSLEHEANIAVAEILKISRDLQNLRKSKDFTDVEFEESEKVVNSKSFVPTTGGINDLDQIEEARNIQEFASKPADYNPVKYNRMVKGKNERKQDRVNETPQKCTSNTRMLKNCELNSSSEPSSNCKSYEDQQKAITTKKTSTVTGNLSDLLLKKCDILKKNIAEVPTEVLQKSGSIGVIVPSSHAQVNNGQDNLNQVTDDLKELSDMLVVSAKNEKVKKRRGKRINKIPKVAQVGIEPEKQTEQTREDNIQRSPIVAEQERIEDSSKVVEIVNSPEENHHIQEDTGKTDKISIINDVQFTKEANGNPSEGIQIASLPKQTQQLQEEMANLVKLPIITDDKQRCLNVVDPPIIPQNYKSEKLDMPVLFDSFSNEYEGAIKNDEFYKPLKKRKHSLESIETPQIVQDRKFEENQLTRLLNEDQVPRHSLTQSKVSRKHSDDSDKYNLRSSDIGNNTDGSDKLKLGKSEKLMRLKNKRTQTENILCRPKGRPLTKPVLNFVLTRTQKKDDYKVRTCATNRKYVRTYELGPNPHPKFKIVPANKPYTFEPKKNAEGNYPNTTWIKCVESGRVSLDYLNTADIHNERAVIISNQLLEGDQKFEHLEIKKERVVDVIQPKNLKELSKREVIDVKLQNSEALSLGERKNVDTFVNLYDDIEPYLFEDDASPRSLRSSSTVGFSISKVFQSIDDGDIDSREESEDKTSSETSNIIISNPPLNQIDGVNIPTSLSNYRQDMKINYDNLMEKLQRSFDNLFNSTTSITEGRSISSRLMLENLNGLAREHESKILVKRPFEGIKTDAVDDAVKVIHSSINKNSGDKRKTLTLPEYYKQIKVKCFEKSDHTFTLKVELPKKLRSKDDGIKTPKNSGKLLERTKLKPPASQRTISTPKVSMFSRSTHASLPTNKLADHGLKSSHIYPNVLGPYAVQNKVSDVPKLEFNNNQNCTVANSGNQKLTPPATPKTSFSCHFECKKDLLPRNLKRSKGKTVESENNSNILAKTEIAYSKKCKPRNLHNYALRSSSIKTYETRSFPFENNPSEDLNLLRNTPNSPEQLTNYEIRSITNRVNKKDSSRSYINKLIPSTSHSDDFECKVELFQRNSKEIKDKTRISKTTRKQIKKHKEFVGNHRSSVILNRSKIQFLVEDTVSCNSKNSCKAKNSSIVNPYVLLKQETYGDIDQYNRGKTLEMKEDRSSVITQASRSRKNEFHRTFDDFQRIKTSSPEKTVDLISRSKSGMVSTATPSYSGSLQESIKSSKKKKKSKKSKINKEPAHEILRERLNYSDSTRAIVSPSKSKSSCVSKSKFKKPKYLVRIPIYSISEHLQNNVQNPEDVLAALLKNSEPINNKKDIDERAIKYNLLKQKLKLARTTEHPTLNSKIRKDCFVHLPRYNFINMWATKKKNSCKQDTTPFYLASRPIQDSDMNTYVADMNNNSKMSLEVGSTVGKGSKRKIKKKIAEEDKVTPYPVNQYDYLDGPNDSSSDDEKAIKPTVKKRCRQPRKGFSQTVKYSPLKVNFSSPTKANLQKQAILRGEDAKDTSECQPPPKYKRKLSFSKNISLNRTEIEERLICSYKPKEKAQLKSTRRDPATVVQDKVSQFNTEDDLKLHTQNEFDTTLMTSYQKVRTTMQIQHNKTASEMDTDKTNQNIISQEQNIFTPLITMDYQNIVRHTTQPSVPKQLFESIEHVSPNVSKESQKNIGTSSPITPYQKLLQTKLEGQNRDVDPSLLTSYQEQPKNSRTNLETENGRSNMKIESLKILGTAPISPYEKKPSKLSQNDPQVDYLDDMQLSNSSASLSDDIFSPSMPNSFSSEVSVEDKNQEINGLERQARDPAELYDEKNKFIPQAGTSKFTNTRKLTQISESSDEILTPKPISLNSNGSVVTENELKLSADSEKDSSEKSSEIDRVTPYQKENVGFEVGEALCKSRIESSGSEITPYQKEQNLHHSNLKLTTCLNIFEFADQNLPSENECKILVPKFQPPSRNFIEATMQEYNIPMESHQEPFYGDAKDVTGPMEVGVRILKIPSNKIVDITEFESSFKGINYYRRVFLEHMYPNEKITNKDIHNYKMSFYKSTKCIIIPAKLPPSRQEIELWLKSKLEKKQKIPKVIGRKKIIIPCSPGADNDSNNSLTVSPCTSLDETLKNVRQITEDETSKSSLETISDNISPMKKNDSLKCHGKGISQNSSVKSNQSSENTSSSQELDITKQRRRDSCQITGVTLDRTNNFAISCDNLQNAKAVSEYLHLTVFSMELIIETRNDYKPNPSHDAIRGIVYQIFNDVPEDDLRKRSVKDGIFINNDETIQIFETETSMITKFVEFLIDCDPDILVGYEIQMLSWGYLIQRGYTLNLNLISLLSRVPQSTKSKPEDDLSDLTIPGRITLDFWRLLRHEIALQSYTFENIVYHILHQRVPLYSFKNITFWWNHVSGLYRNKVLRYYFYRVEATLRIMDQLDLIGRTSELAKLFGIQFFEVLSRGSQFRVESMMLRLAKPLNYIPVSPSVQQRANMRAPESLPLIMEPQSKFYADPVIVLDFQSLYPSMIIAYNYCFSTCLGRIEHLGRDIPFEFGATQLKVPRKYIKRLSRKDVINISPCGVGFVKKTVREGILPRMLQEILDTRLMVKKSLKKNAGNKTLEKVLDARQLGLKLIANVTYGYTAANFSGRMPCIEVGDSVVSKGRETLQRAINLVERTPKWGAKVVYGDTDSLFVLVPGKSRQEAFKIGAEIAEAVTNDNPSPVKLKLEKVFHPCILQTKKRYVGYMYESPEQDEPEYLAKGIETVRRDGCPAVSKILEKCLKILFDTRDVSLVRQYVVRQFSKILSGRVSIQDLTFAKEYRGASSYRPGACVPALELTRKWLAIDKRNEPRRGERVPYVIVNGPPGLPLIRLVRCPRELIADPALRPNALYYITKVIIPPINRCLLLIGADVNNWFNDMPRKQYQYLHTSSPVKGKKSTISQYFTTKKCVICGLQSKDGICEVCLSKPQNTSVILHEKVRVLEQNCYETKMICESCCGTSDKVTCISLDCPVYYKRIQTEKEVQQTPFIRELISLLPNLDF